MAIEIKKNFTAEQSPNPEKSLEQSALKSSSSERIPAGTTAPPSKITLPAARPAPQIVDAFQKEVEAVLTENIGDIYKQLPADRKTLFKQKGESVAEQITAMIKGGMLQIKKILKLIREWLLIIPGVNKYFLEQEAKIKTDKIQQLYEREHAVAL
jgi:hypothetical protein